MGQLLLNGVVSGLLLALPALAVSLTFGILKFPNFAVGGGLTLGAYAGWVFNTQLGIHIVAAALLAAAAVALVSVVLDVTVFGRLREQGSIALMVASMGVSLILENLCRFVFGNATRSLDVAVARPLRWAGLRITHEQIVTAVTVLGCLILLHLVLRRTPLGRAMRAVADNPTLAAARGIERASIVRLTWAIIGSLTGLAGVLAALDRAVEPLVGWSYQIPVFAAAILGGLGSPLGAVLGALAVGLSEELATLVVPTSYRQAVGFAMILLLLLVRSQGLLGARALRK
ncbi:branched-chain amino acid ABC transporter permease [uncultured Methylobacterium sp.]|uniref:branched-chain amino acid ABC transporter permease n=1 Tax=uncultured Methylobacterium sp. TaxID=157278 RepID=UPI0035CB1462